MNDYIIFIILQYLFPDDEYKTLFLNDTIRNNYIKYVNEFNKNIVKESIYLNGSNLFYLFLFEKNTATKEDIDELFMVMDFDHMFEPPFYYELDKIMKVIKNISNDLLLLNPKNHLRKTNFKRINKYNHKVYFKICNREIMKKPNRLIYTLDLIDNVSFNNE